MYSAWASKANISIKSRHEMKNEGCLLRREGRRGSDINRQSLLEIWKFFVDGPLADSGLQHVKVDYIDIGKYSFSSLAVVKIT